MTVRLAPLDPTPRAIPARPAAESRQAAPAESDASGKPGVEWWTVGSDRFDSTYQLMATRPRTAEPSFATYHWFPTREDASPQALAEVTRSNARSGAIGGGLIGFFAGSLVAVASQGSPLGLGLALLLTGGAALAGASLAKTGSEEYTREGSMVAGTLSGNNATFVTADGARVDLAAYAANGDPSSDPWWQHTAPPTMYAVPWRF